MPQGIQVWDASGVLRLDIGSRPFKTLGVFDHSSGSTSQSDANLSLGGVLYQSAPTVDTDNNPPTVSVSGTTITVSDTADGPIGARIRYGFY